MVFAALSQVRSAQHRSIDLTLGPLSSELTTTHGHVGFRCGDCEERRWRYDFGKYPLEASPGLTPANCPVRSRKLKI